MRLLPESRSKRIRIAVAVVLMAACLLLVGVAAAGSKSSACASCHEPQATAMEQTAHSQVGCYDCHLDSGSWSYVSYKTDELSRMYPKALVGGTVSGPAVQTSATACLACHKTIMKSGTVTESNGIRILHSRCVASETTCDGCHASTAHPGAVRATRGMAMEECISCHKAKGARRKCETCHDGKREKDIASRNAFSITHGPNWRKTHGMGQLDQCQVCHEPDSCKRCHGIAVPHTADFGRTHGKISLKDPDSCQTCHTSKQFCTDCHGSTKMPHPKGFLKQHSSVAKGVNDPECVMCHSVPDCDRCHTRHAHPGGARGVPVPPRTVPTTQNAGSNK